MSKLKNTIANWYSSIVSRRSFRKFNEAIVKLGLKGLGLLFSHENPSKNGELFFAHQVIAKYKVANVFDVGANVGSYCKMLIDLGFKNDIFCFEPHPKTFNQLDTSIQMPNVKKYRLAFSFEEGSFPIYDYSLQDGSEHASLFKEVIETVHKSSATTHLVTVSTVDEFSKVNNIERIGLLKIDTEGNEFNVLRGSVNMLRESRIDLVHFEFNEMNVISRVFLGDFMSLLKGYNLYRLLPNGFLPLMPNNSLFNELFSYQNIIAIRKEIDLEAHF
ncbi:MAG: FkbM family methyltransferase [Cyclobacteriaceae bacterium]|nr:FkbM family methyltransferase [Cyclobacteriaceae bacterium]